MKVYESRFLQVKYFAEHNVHENIWLPATASMEEEEYQAESLAFLDIILQNKPKRFVADTREMVFPITPELQTWTNEHILIPIIHTGLEKVAFVVSKEFITQLSIEQTMEEEQGSKLTTRYFEDRETAWNWLIA